LGHSDLKNFLLAIHAISPSILEAYTSCWKAYEVPRKTIMTGPGELEKYLYFVLEGVQKSYFLGEKKQHIIAFAYAPSFSGIPEAFFTQTPSRYFLETITASKFLRIPYSKHIELLKKHREIETLFRKVTEQFLVGVIQRQHELMAMNMESRYRAFVTRSAHLFQIIPHKDIAAYLNINPTNFSKLMNQFPI